MAGRNIKQYIGLSRRVVTNKVLTHLTGQGKSVSFRHQFKGLLEESIFKWLFNDGGTPEPHPYVVDTGETSIYEMPAKTSLAVAADWASDTVQSEKIGVLMGNHNPDYTVHLGDTYYSGSKEEIKSNFSNDRWPMGKIRSFALLGNHEMYNGAFPYFDWLLPKVFRQPNPFFCLRSNHWCILGLDTGYQSILGGRSNNKLHFQHELMNWLTNTVNLAHEKRGIIVLTHHQYVSAFGDETVYPNPAHQLQSFFKGDREIIWVWGHEHRFSMYGKYRHPDGPGGLKYITAYGRCIGHGGMPDEHTRKRKVNPALASKYNLTLWDPRAVDEIPAYIFFKIPIGANGYSLIKLNGEELTINYYCSYTNDPATSPVEQLVVSETWEADNKTGRITCVKTIDHTIPEKGGSSKLAYAEGKTVVNVAK